MERNLIIDGLESERFKNLYDEEATLFAKNANISENLRNVANELFSKDSHFTERHEELWLLYTKSIATAPTNSESIALAYDDRSTFLMHIQKYHDCINDIDRALDIAKSLNLDLGSELAKRKESCLQEIEKTSNGKNFSIDTDLDCTTIKNDEKYGKHLVAKKKINPGEIVLKVKPYTIFVNLSNAYAYCANCLKFSWSTIPCDQCTWCMFCSEKCKSDAWGLYHDVECKVISYLLFIEQDIVFTQTLSTKIFILALKQSGGLEKLKNDVVLIDKCADQLSKGNLGNDGNLMNNFKRLYSLPKNVTSDILQCQVFEALNIAAGFIKYTSVFEDTLKLKDYSEIINDEDIIFVGTLLLKLIGICALNSHSLRHRGLCRHSERPYLTCIEKDCCVRGWAIFIKSSLINHSCDPNISRVFNENAELIFYALKPIEKHAQIFDSYFYRFYQESKEKRNQLLRENSNISCTCNACIENWPTLLSIEPDSQEDKFNEVLEGWKKRAFDFANGTINITGEHLKELSNEICKTLQLFSQPSPCTYSLIDTLDNIFETMLGFRFNSPLGCKKD